MMTGERLHDRRLVQELDSLSETGRLVDGLHGYMCFRLALDNVLGDAFVDHPERSLTQLSQDVDLVSGDLPFILLVHCNFSTSELVMCSLLCKPSVLDTIGFVY